MAGMDTLKQTVGAGFDTLADNLTVDATDPNSMFQAAAAIKLNESMFEQYGEAKIGQPFFSLFSSGVANGDTIISATTSALLDKATYPVIDTYFKSLDIFGGDGNKIATGTNTLNMVGNIGPYKSCYTIVDGDVKGGLFNGIYEYSLGSAVRHNGYTYILEGGKSSVTVSGTYISYTRLIILDSSGKQVHRGDNMTFCDENGNSSIPIYLHKGTDGALYIICTDTYKLTYVYKITTNPFAYKAKTDFTANMYNFSLIENTATSGAEKMLVMSDDSFWCTYFDTTVKIGYLADIKSLSTLTLTDKTSSFVASNTFFIANTSEFAVKKATRFMNLNAYASTDITCIASLGTTSAPTVSPSLTTSGCKVLSNVFKAGTTFKQYIQDPTNAVRLLSWGGTDMNLSTNTVSGIAPTLSTTSNALTTGYTVLVITSTVAYGNSLYLLSQNNLLYKSSDGLTYTSVSAPSDMDLTCPIISYIEDRFILVTANDIYTPTDCVTFTKISLNFGKLTAPTLNSVTTTKSASLVSPFAISSWALDATHTLVSIEVSLYQTYVFVLNNTTNTATLIVATSMLAKSSTAIQHLVITKLDSGDFCFVFDQAQATGTFITNNMTTVTTPAELISGESLYFVTPAIPNISATGQYTQYAYIKIK